MRTVTTLPRGLAFTRVDLDRMPDDGRRHELVDGTLIVTPAPSLRHQRALRRLTLLLEERCPSGLELLFAPFDVVLGPATVLQPDLLIAVSASFTDRDLPTAPLLAVEVLSPSTRSVDLTLKRSLYEAAGCPSYWVVDPDEPTLTAWELREGGYVEVARVAGAEEFTALRPFPVTVRPDRLVT